MTEQRREIAADEALLRVLQDVIGRTAISPADDFYLIGGHSLLIAETVGRLRTEFGFTLDVGQFATNSQVAALIAACRPVE